MALDSMIQVCCSIGAEATASGGGTNASPAAMRAMIWVAFTPTIEPTMAASINTVTIVFVIMICGLFKGLGFGQVQALS